MKGDFALFIGFCPIRGTVLLCTSANWKTAKPVPKPRKHFGSQSWGKHRNRTY